MSKRKQPKFKSLNETPDFTRASPYSICETCGKIYIDHQRIVYQDKTDTDFPLVLFEICNGKQYKL